MSVDTESSTLIYFLLELDLWCTGGPLRALLSLAK